MVHKIKLAHNLNKNVSRIFIVTLTHQVKVNSFVVTIGISGRLRVSRPILMEFIDNINNILTRLSTCRASFRYLKRITIKAHSRLEFLIEVTYATFKDLNLNNYFNLHICLSVHPSICVCHKLAPILVVTSQNNANKVA